MKTIYLMLLITLGFGWQAFSQVDTALSIKNVVESEILPEFPNGEDSLVSYLSKNIIYPKKALINEIQGKVTIAFVVCEDGTVCNVKPLKGDPMLQTEAMRVVRAMPKWKPGIKDGKNVSVCYALPIMFSLEDETRQERKARRAAAREARKNK